MYKAILYIIGFLFFIILLLIIASKVAYYQFQKTTDKKVRQLFDIDTISQTPLVSESDLVKLPENVRRWLVYSQVVGRPYIQSVRAKQTVSMRLSKGKAWIPATVKQYIATKNQEFIWNATIQAAPLFHISGRDTCIDGHGNMIIKLFSLLTIANAKGAEIDQGSFIRYLAEIVWYPTYALDESISWKSIDKNTAKATMKCGNNGDNAVSGIFYFDESGYVTKFTADRYGDFNGEYRIEKWTATMGPYREFNGILIPSSGQITWNLEDGDFTWYHFEIVNIEYNTPHLYPNSNP